jgi:hypothetical protein
MEIHATRLVCSATGADLSPRVRAQLEEIVDGTATPTVECRRDQQLKWGVRWFCPFDARSLTEVDGVLECDACGRAIPGRLVYEIVEFNPH